MQRYTDLKVWERSHQLALEVYRETPSWPGAERFGLTGQVRRAAVSVATNIAEGSKRAHGGDFARFLNVAEGSLAEVGYLLLLGRDLGSRGAAEADRLRTEVEEISRMAYGLRRKVEETA
jgi:four helix bundle protein